LDDPRFADAGAIRRHRTEVIAILDEIVAQRPLEVWAERFDREGVWWAPAQTPAEVVDDPQLLANGGIAEIDGGETAAVQRSVNGPVSFSDVAGRRYAPVPRLGQHTEEVLAELADRAEAPAPGRVL
jgi:crotonobetainyl-CoA:carnitine CoA-transferase CaiB-like acyl-CoA transferase